MNYKRLLKGYTTTTTSVAVETYSRSESDVKEIIEYFDYLQENYFTDMPYSRQLSKSFIWNIPDNVFKYMTKLIAIDAPITCQPLTMLYGQCLDDIDAYPNFMRRLIEYNVDNEADVVDYVNANQQILETDEGDNK